MIRLHQRDGFLSDSNDVRGLVLEVAMRLTDAKKGLAVARASRLLLIQGAPPQRTQRTPSGGKEVLPQINIG